MCILCDSLGTVLRDAANGKSVAFPSASKGWASAPAIPPADRSEGADAAASTATRYGIEVGDIFEGNIGTGSDSDWIEVSLEAGESYVFLVWGTGGESAGVNDTQLTLHNWAGSQVAYNDDMLPSQGNAFSAIEYTAIQGGTYYLDVAAYGGELGDYRLLASPAAASVETAAIFLSEIEWGAPMPLRFDPGASGRLTVNLTGLTADARDLARWALEQWETVSPLTFAEVTGQADITFDDRQSGAFAGPDSYWLESGINSASSVNVGTDWVSSYGATYDSYSFETFLHEIGHALGLGHMGPYSGPATIGTDNIFANDSTLLSVMSYFEPHENPNVDGMNVVALTPMLADIVAIQALYGFGEAHEGHTVWGANATVGGTLGDAFAILYDNAPADDAFWDGHAVTYTIYDTGGIDTLDLSTVDAGQNIDLKPGTVSDAGGIDGGLAIAAGTVIEHLRTGEGADVLRGNDADNVLDAGGGDDSVYGGAGTDTAVLAVRLADVDVTAEGPGVLVRSDAGTDYYQGVERFEFDDTTLTLAELLDVAAGPSDPEPRPDPVDLDPEPHPVDLDPEPEPTDPAQVPDEDAALDPEPADDPEEDETDVDPVSEPAEDTGAGQADEDPAEEAQSDPEPQPDEEAPGDAPDVMDPDDPGPDAPPEAEPERGSLIAGTEAPDTLAGGDFGDTISGQAGADALTGGAGDDLISGSHGDDTIMAGAGADNIGGGHGNDLIDAGDGDDTVGGGRDDDSIFGGLGDDVVNGGAGADEIDGGFGNDTSGAGTGMDYVIGGDGDDSLGGGTGRDTILGGAGNDSIGAGEGNDTVDAGAGDDFVAGGGRHDLLDGGDGRDSINGGAGNDTLTGGLGDDIFIFNTLNAGESDVITDFTAGQDRLRLVGVENAEGSGLRGYLDALGPRADGADTVLTYGGHEIRLENVAPDALQIEDFLFV